MLRPLPLIKAATFKWALINQIFLSFFMSFMEMLQESCLFYET